jgi:hypothetical protein
MKEKDRRLWIMPWVSIDAGRRGEGRIYPQASSLGLPTEIGEQILYESYSIAELNQDVKELKQNKKERVAWAGDLPKLDKHKLHQMCVNRFEGELVTTLSRRIGIIRQLSPLVNAEMEYVSKKWQPDLEGFLKRELRLRLHAPKLPIAADGYEWLLMPDVGDSTTKEGQVVKAKGKKVKKRVRGQKCWHCNERHYSRDPVYPMARRDPEKWMRMTKKVGGWRAAERGAKLTFTGKKVVFEN